MTRMIKMEVSELSGPALRYAVAIADGWDFSSQLDRIAFSGFCPDTDWSQGGPLLEKHYIELSIGDEGYWANRICTSRYGYDTRNYHGNTMLIAACRAIVATKLGDAVQVPAELVDGGGV